MKISEAIETLVKAKKALGDIDLVWVHNQQFADVSQIYSMTLPTKSLEWCWSGPVVVVTLDKS